MSSERQEKTLKKQRRLQIITGLLYAKKWRFTTVDIDDKNNNTETLILTDMFSLYKPIVFEFSTITNNILIILPTLGVINIPPQIVDIPVGLYRYDLKVKFPNGS